MSTALFWHRRDLRINDNAGLHKALTQCTKVIPVFVFDSTILGLLPKNDQRVLFIHQELEKIKMQNKNLEIDVFVDKGNAKTDIIEKANTENVNYMVIGTHGRTGISHVFMGSTAEYIIRHATKPIFVIPMNTLKH